MESDSLRQLIQEIVRREMERGQASVVSPVPVPPPAPPAPPPVAGPGTAPVPASAGNRLLEFRFAGRVLTAADLAEIAPQTDVVIAPGTIVSPLVHDIVRERRLRLRVEGENGLPTIAVGSDHGGFAMKEAVKQWLQEWGYPFFDYGTHADSAVDYPEFAHKVARAVADNHQDLGIIADGAGIGSCIAANKVPGIRAALCYDVATARNSREHNYANVLTLGGRLLRPEEAKAIVRAWLETPYGEERHARRVRLIGEIEKKYLKD